MNPDKLCMGCMKPVEGNKCRACGFDRQEYEKNRSMRILPTGTVLHGRYLTGKTLGIGGFGITYLAMDLEKKKKVAIKEFFPNGLAERTVTGTGGGNISVSGEQQRQYYQKGLDSFVREANTMRAFRNLEGIVQVFDFFRENNTGYLVMEYLPGMSLRVYTKVSGLPLKEDDVLELIWPVINSLAMIHRKGIIHRDISPDNIIYGMDHSITLIDFGAARQRTSDSNKSLTIMLKHGYAPMEQYYTQGKQGAWTDVYAICATIYYLLSGKVPPDSISRFALDNMVPLRTMNSNVSAQVSNAIQKGLAIKIEDRYQTMEELITELYAGKYVVEGTRDSHVVAAEGRKKAEENRMASVLEPQEEKKSPQSSSVVEKRKEQIRTEKYPAKEWNRWDNMMLGAVAISVFFSYVADNRMKLYFSFPEWLLISGVAAVLFQLFLLRRCGIRGWMISLPISFLLVAGVIYIIRVGLMDQWLLLFYYGGFLSGILSIIWMIWGICLETNRKGGT